MEKTKLLNSSYTVNDKYSIKKLFSDLNSINIEVKNNSSKKIGEYLDEIWSSKNKNYYLKYISKINALNINQIDLKIMNVENHLELCLLHIKKNLLEKNFGIIIHNLSKSNINENEFDNNEFYEDILYSDNTVIYDGDLTHVKIRYIEFSSLEELGEFYLERRKIWSQKGYYNNDYRKYTIKDYSKYIIKEYIPLNNEYFSNKKETLLKESNLKQAKYNKYAEPEKHKKNWIEKYIF